MICLRRLIPCLLLLSLSACQPVTIDEGTATGADEAETSAGDSTTSGGGGGGEPVFNCDPSDEAACPPDQKCTVLGPPSAPVYDCVADDGFLLPYESCTPAPSNGQDGCPSGFTCLPVSAESSGQGLCLQLCSVDGDCELALCAASHGSLVKVCGAICDPLAPGCPETQDCQRIRQAAFVCQFPGPEDDGTQAEACNANRDLGCAEGFVCQTGQIVPDCTESSCCTSLCDLSEPDPCGAEALCGDLDLDPVPGLEDVGACYIPQ